MKLFQQKEIFDLNNGDIVFVGDDIIEFKTEKELFIEETKKLASEKMKDIKPLITIIGNEFEGSTIDEKRENAREYFEKNFKNRKFINEDWEKREIKVLGDAKTFSQTASINKINTFKYLDLMLENAIYIISGDDTKKRPNVKKWHYLSVKITNSMKKNINELIIFSVREDNNGNIYYNHTINEEIK